MDYKFHLHYHVESINGHTYSDTLESGNDLPELIERAGVFWRGCKDGSFLFSDEDRDIENERIVCCSVYITDDNSRCVWE